MAEVESAMLYVVLGLTGIAMICGFIKMCKKDDPKYPDPPKPPPPDAFQVLKDIAYGYVACYSDRLCVEHRNGGRSG